MKLRIRSTFFVLTFLVLFSLACSISVAQPKASTADDIATQVAATVSAELTAVVVDPTETGLTAAPADPAASPTPLPVFRLFYIDGSRNLFIWTESGGSQMLVSSGDVGYLVPAPDGSRVAYTRTSDYLNYSLWVINNDGGSSHELVSIKDFTTMKTDPEMQGLAPDFLIWTPDGSSLAFTTSPKYEGPGYSIQEDLWVVNANSGERRQLLPVGAGGAFYFSPDGSKIALVKPDRINVANADGTNLKEVFTYTPVITYSEYAYRAVPVWSPDSASLWTSIPPADPITPGQSTGIWRIPTDGTTAAQLGSIYVNFLTPVALSHNQDRILYISDGVTSRDNIAEVHIANADGSGDSIFMTGDSNGPLQWSPDGKYFNFNLGSGYNTQVGQVGAGFASMGDTGMAAGVEWIDDSSFLFMNKPGSAWEIRRASIAGTSSVLASLAGDPDTYFPFYDFSN